MKDWTHLRKELSAYGSDTVSDNGSTYNLIPVFDIAKWTDYYYPFLSVFVDSENAVQLITEDNFPNAQGLSTGLDNVDETLIDVWLYAGFDCETSNEEESTYDDAAELCINDLVLKYRGYMATIYEDVNYYTIFEPMIIESATRMVSNENMTKGAIAIKGKVKALRYYK